MVRVSFTELRNRKQKCGMRDRKMVTDNGRREKASDMTVTVLNFDHGVSQQDVE